MDQIEKNRSAKLIKNARRVQENKRMHHQARKRKYIKTQTK